MENEDEATGLQLTLGQAFARAVALRCPYCGGGRLFSGVLRMNRHCLKCGTLFEREPGYFLGSAYINYGFTALITTVSYLMLHFGLSWPNGVVMPAVLGFCLVFPLVFFRYARSLWLSLDCFFDRVGAEEAIARTRTEPPPGKKPSGSPK